MEWNNKYNSFNSLKALKHVNHWKNIIDNDYIPFPFFVSLDLCGYCNYKCPHCNASKVTNKNIQMTKETMNTVLKVFIKNNVKCVCLGGGGESSLNPNISYLVEKLYKQNIKIGLVTNGSNIEYIKDYVNMFEWIGISMDAATKETYSKIKGVNEKMFDIVLDNIERLRSKSEKVELSYKYLLHPNNVPEVYFASSIAKDIGCDLIHIRPGSEPWFDKETPIFTFINKEIEHVLNQIEYAREVFEDENFKVYGITHKFSNNWKPLKSFKNCYSCFTTCYISPDGMVGLCCDRRGDKAIELCHISEIEKYWGLEKHREIQKNINVENCPRCTYNHINEIFENVIINDKMKCDFI